MQTNATGPVDGMAPVVPSKVEQDLAAGSEGKLPARRLFLYEGKLPAPWLFKAFLHKEAACQADNASRRFKVFYFGA